MTADPFDLHWLTPRLAIGGRIRPEWLPSLAGEHRVARVVDLRGEDCDDEEELRRHGIHLLHLPTPDLRCVSQEMLSRGVEWIREGFARDERVLVHCEHGIGRSALLSLCVLVTEGFSPLEAMRLAKSVRWKVSPSPEQIEAYLQWVESWFCARGEKCPPTSWDELAAIAYSHLLEASVL